MHIHANIYINIRGSVNIRKNIFTYNRTLQKTDTKDVYC